METSPEDVASGIIHISIRAVVTDSVRSLEGLEPSEMVAVGVSSALVFLAGFTSLLCLVLTRRRSVKQTTHAVRPVLLARALG